MYINIRIHVFEQGYSAGIYNLLTSNHLNYDEEIILLRVQGEEGTQGKTHGKDKRFKDLN